jgi:myo-inositol 2-dehydrogenase/D-chiro-inositol 1-dehydrogenase
MKEIRPMLNFCVFGAGRIGKVHAPNIAFHPKAHLSYVVDPNLAAARALAEPFGAEALASGEAALADDELDAVLICGPTPTHVDLSIAAARAGKSIFCEKPIDIDIGRVDECVAEVTRANVPFYLGFHMRFDPSFREVREAVREGVIGKVEQVNMAGRDPAPPTIEYIKQSGGIFRDAMIHSIDFLRWMLAEDPTEVYAMGECLIDPEIGKAGDVDTAMVLLRTKSGTLCNITGSRHSPHGSEGSYAEIFGSKGLLRVGTAYPTWMEAFTEAGPLRRTGFTGFQDRFDVAYKAELDHFIEAVINRTGLETGLEDGRRSLIIAEAAQKSVETRRPVQIRYDAAAPSSG